MTLPGGTDRSGIEPAGRGPWFGPVSFAVAMAGVLVNVLPLVVIPFLLLMIGILCVLELAFAAVLFAGSGTIRQIGTGLAVSVVATLAVIPAGMVLYSTRG